MYLRGEYDECLRVVEEELEAAQGLCEFPIFVKALILRQQGKIRESLHLFQAATCLSPKSLTNLKQVARSLLLLGRYRAALEVLEAASAQAGTRDRDWEVEHFRGVCHARLGEAERAAECFMASIEVQRHDATYLELARAFESKGDMASARDCLLEAVEESPDNARLLTELGLLFLRMGDSVRAFEYLGNSLARDPRDPSAILAAGSILQDHDDADVALSKYRVAAAVDAHSPELWNNVGVAFHAKGKLVAAAACLQRARYLAPFEWTIAQNLGIVYLATSQWASAFLAFSSAANLKAGRADTLAYVGVALAKLGDTANAEAAYQKSLKLDDANLATHCNFALLLHRLGRLKEAHEHVKTVLARVAVLSDEARDDLQEHVPRLANRLARSIQSQLASRASRD
jgi:Bardet-Biedl syndrome 4 protein